MNNYICTGRTGKDIELKTSQQGKPYCNFSLAVESGFGNNKKTNWIYFTAFGKTAETLAKYVPKGTRILIKKAEVVVNEYTDRDGNKRNATNFNVYEFEFCESKNAQQTQNQSSEQTKTDNDGFMNIPDNVDEELPFN